jgi:hypothetical protein
VSAFLAAEQWPWTRRRPGKPDLELDARKLVPAEGLRWEDPADGAPPPALHLSLVRDAEGAGLPVHDFLAALFGATLPEPRWCSVTRTGILGRDAAGRWLSPYEEIERLRRRVWFQAHIND